MAGLFDTYKSPDEVKRDIRTEGIAQDRSAPTGWGAISSAAAGGGRMLAQGLGGQDPRVAQAEKMKAAMEKTMQSGLQPENPEFYKFAANALQEQGLMKEAMNASMQGAQLAEQLKVQKIDLDYKRALTQQALSPKDARTTKKKQYDELISMGVDRKEAYSAIYGGAKGDTVVIDMGDKGAYPIPRGYMLKNKDKPEEGVTPIPGGPADKTVAEAASKTQMLRTAEKQLKGIKKILYDKEGNINWTSIGTGRVPLVGGSVPWTEGRELATMMEYGIQGITRLETGAAMPPQEVENTRKRFQPIIGDTDETVAIKMDMFEDFITGGLALLDPAGRFLEERFQSEYEKRMAAKEQLGEVAPIAPTVPTLKTPPKGASVQELVDFYGR